MVIILVLFVSGLLRSMQFTSLNTIAFADVPYGRMSAATSFSSMGQQVSLGMGVTVGAILLQLTPVVRALLFGRPLDGIAVGLPEIADFRIAFGVIALACFASILVYRRLPSDAGAEVSGHSCRTRVPDKGVLDEGGGRGGAGVSRRRACGRRNKARGRSPFPPAAAPTRPDRSPSAR